MSTVYSCPHCRAQNFATRDRLRLARRIPLMCWKCGKKIEKPIPQENPSKGRKAKVRKTERFSRDKS